MTYVDPYGGYFITIAQILYRKEQGKYSGYL